VPLLLLLMMMMIMMAMMMMRAGTRCTRRDKCGHWNGTGQASRRARHAASRAAALRRLR
jgi:hypothetical protein